MGVAPNHLFFAGGFPFSTIPHWGSPMTMTLVALDLRCAGDVFFPTGNPAASEFWGILFDFVYWFFDSFSTFAGIPYAYSLASDGMGF